MDSGIYNAYVPELAIIASPLTIKVSADRKRVDVHIAQILLTPVPCYKCHTFPHDQRQIHQVHYFSTAGEIHVSECETENSVRW